MPRSLISWFSQYSSLTVSVSGGRAIRAVGLAEIRHKLTALFYLMLITDTAPTVLSYISNSI